MEVESSTRLSTQKIKFKKYRPSCCEFKGQKAKVV